MKFTKIENARWASENQTIIECDVYFEDIEGATPFAANPEDCTDHGRLIFSELISGKHGTILPFTPAQTVGVAIMVPEPSLDDTKLLKLAEVAAWRYARETGGIVVDGVPISTDRESQLAVTSAYTSMKNGLVAQIDWKAVDGSWVPLGFAELEEIAKQLALHVQACFAQERQLVQRVQAAVTIDEVAAITLPT